MVCIWIRELYDAVTKHEYFPPFLSIFPTFQAMQFGYVFFFETGSGGAAFVIECKTI